MNPLELPPLTKHVTDLSGVLSNQQAELLAAKFAEHENATTEQVLTVLIPHRQGHELLDIGLKLFNENGIGQKDLNNGLLLIVSTEEKKLRIITGKGMEIKYSEMICREIVERHLRPLLDAERYVTLIDTWLQIVNGTLVIEDRSYPIDNDTSAAYDIQKLVDTHRKPILISIIVFLFAMFSSSLVSSPLSMVLIGLFMLAIGVAILYGARYFYKNNTSESIGTRKVATFLFICVGISLLFLGTENIRCQVVTSQHCTYWNSPSPTYSGGGSYSSDSDWGSSSSSSSYDGGGGSSNGGGYGD